MHAFVVRPERYGEPRDAFRHEVIPTPSLAPDEVLVYVMASGINYNNVWAALGQPVDVVAERQRRGEPEDFHAGGSDCSGIVWKVGEAVTTVQPGDEVVVHGATWAADDPWVLAGKRPGAVRDDPGVGLPDQLRQLLPVRPGAGPPVPRPSPSASPGRRRAAT